MEEFPDSEDTLGNRGTVKLHNKQKERIDDFLSDISWTRAVTILGDKALS